MHVSCHRHQNTPTLSEIGNLWGYYKFPPFSTGPFVFPGVSYEVRMTTTASSKVMHKLKMDAGITNKSNNLHGLRHTVVNLMLDINCPE